MKKLLLLVLLFGLKYAVAQSPFKPVPKVLVPTNRFFRAILQHDSTMNAWRFIANLAAYAEPGNILMAGAGYGYQHLKYNYATAKWEAQWSLSAIGFAGGSVAPTTPASIVSVGIMGGIVNNLLMVGPIYNFGTKQLGVAVSLGISLNN